MEGVVGDFAKLERLRLGMDRLATTGFDGITRVVQRVAAAELQAGFEGSRGADGTPWAPTTDGRPALVTYGKHWTTRVVGKKVALSSDHVGARAHQLGAEIRPASASVLAFTVGGRKVFARKVTLPARRVTPRNGSLEGWARPINDAVSLALPMLAGLTP